MIQIVSRVLKITSRFTFYRPIAWYCHLRRKTPVQELTPARFQVMHRSFITALKKPTNIGNWYSKISGGLRIAIAGHY